MISLIVYLLLGIGLVGSNIMNLSPDDHLRYKRLKKQAPGALIIGLGISVIFWLPILFYGLFFAKKRE